MASIVTFRPGFALPDAEGSVQTEARVAAPERNTMSQSPAPFLTPLPTRDCETCTVGDLSLENARSGATIGAARPGVFYV